MVKVENLHIAYDSFTVQNISFEVAKGEYFMLLGASGAGKTTLLQILGTLDKPYNNKDAHFELNGINVASLSDKEIAKFRNNHIGFIFQFHQLLPEFTALENVCIPAFINGSSKSKATLRAKELLDFLGFDNRYHHKPNALSGGEQQRGARA